MAEVVLRGALVEGETCDVRIVDGTIDLVSPARLSPTREVDEAEEAEVELDGFVLLPSAVEPHAHLDKAFLADLVPNPAGDLAGAIDGMQAALAGATAQDVAARAVRAGRLMASRGYTAVRTHVDVTAAGGLVPIEGVLAARQLLADIIDVEIVALCESPVTGVAGADRRALLGDALELGADLVGGCPHLEPAGTTPATECLLGIAADHGVGVDLHTDETLDPTVLGILDLIAAVDAGFPHRVTASHCVSLGMLPEADQRRIAAEIARTGIGVVTNPQTSLYLHARSAPTAPPRGLTSVGVLRQAGVAVAAGQDNLQDPFNPLGRGDPFEIAGLLVLAAHLDVDDAYRSVSTDARTVLGREPVRIAAGSPADLLAVRAATLREAISMAPSADGDRIVLRRRR
jgi:cytosine deaminase